MEMLDGGRISIAALAVGIAQGAYRVSRALCKRATAVWKTDLRVSGNPIQACGHGDADRCGETVDVSRRMDEGSGKEDDERVVDGEAVCF